MSRTFQALGTAIFLHAAMASGSVGAEPPTTPPAATRPADELSPRASRRVEELRASIKTFRLSVNYGGPQDKPFYHVILSVTPPSIRRNDAFHLYVTISREEARRVIDQLAASGFLDKAIDLSHDPGHPVAGPTYTLTASEDAAAGPVILFEDLGWNLAMLRRLQGIRETLEKPHAEQMDFLLTRLSGLRRQWEKQEARRN